MYDLQYMQRSMRNKRAAFYIPLFAYELRSAYHLYSKIDDPDVYN